MTSRHCDRRQLLAAGEKTKAEDSVDRERLADRFAEAEQDCVRVAGFPCGVLADELKDRGGGRRGARRVCDFPRTYEYEPP